jgi:hypothetical protein
MRFPKITCRPETFSIVANKALIDQVLGGARTITPRKRRRVREWAGPGGLAARKLSRRQGPARLRQYARRSRKCLTNRASGEMEPHAMPPGLKPDVDLLALCGG